MRPLARFITFLGVLALIASTVMLPWTEDSLHYQYIRDQMQAITVHAWAGYHPVFKPPSQVIQYNDDGNIKLTADYVIDHDRLLLEWVFIVLVTVGLVFVVTPKKQTSFSIK